MLVTGESAVRGLLARILDEERGELIASWSSGPRAGNSAVPELRREAAELLTALHEAVNGETPVEEIVERDARVREALAAVSGKCARAGAAPSATAMAVLGLKRLLLDAVERRAADPDLRYAAASLVNDLLDSAGIHTVTVYVDGREEIIRRQHEQMLELSTPVVRLWRNVLAVPLIGTLDSARTQVVMTGLLEAIQSHEARVAIIDITGVPTVDTAVAQHLLQTVNAVRLMGADCLVSGIRPSIAQTIAQLGIDLSHIVTRASLADALAAAMRMLGVHPEEAAG